jgi:hypothetical protein
MLDKIVREGQGNIVILFHLILPLLKEVGQKVIIVYWKNKFITNVVQKKA